MSKNDQLISERVAGATPYRETLTLLQSLVEPGFYLELGVRNGESLALANCDAIGVDPAPDLTAHLKENVSVFRETSDDFFQYTAPYVLNSKVDLAFIDGMHLFEFALRDFINVEKYSHNNTVVIFDDIFPNHPLQAKRDRTTSVWTGDIWKIVSCLEKYRPDLKLMPLDTNPSGLLLVAGLDPENRVLEENYEGICNHFLSEAVEFPPQDVLDREGVSPADGSELVKFIKATKQTVSPASGTDYKMAAARDKAIKNAPPEISVIVISYNMAREIPRTIRSLSTHMQTNIKRDDYEIILVDNGSTISFDEQQCKKWGSNLLIHYMENPSSSPVEAINKGLELASGRIVGVMIDGARMASPGLLSTTLAAVKMHDRPIVAAMGFHLGSELQNDSIKQGYSQQEEDRLLESIAWNVDGYRLFDISTPCTKGLFLPVAESNAIFTTKQIWLELEGFDSRFKQPGGGLVNLDTYKRACELPESQLIMLLAEGTFHQVHGGIATNPEEHPFLVFNEEYKKLRGCDYQIPEMPTNTIHVGIVNKHVLPILRYSANKATGMTSRKIMRRSRIKREIERNKRKLKKLLFK